MKRLGKSLADWLISEELVRDPYTAGDQAVVFVEPVEGAPSPLDLKDTAACDITLTIHQSGGMGSTPYGGFLDRRSLLLVYRAKPGKEKDLIDLSNQLDGALDDKRAWTMGDLRVEIAQLLQPLQVTAVSDPEQGSFFTAEYLFLIRKSELI